MATTEPSTPNTDLSLQTQLSQPLAGKTLLVTRSLSQSSQFSQSLSQAGAKVIEMPALEIGPPSSWVDLDAAINNISNFDWLILTSINGVDYFFERLAVKNQNAAALAGLKIAVVGEKTAKSLQRRSITPDFIPPNFVADALVANFPENLAGKKVLFPRVETGGREVLVKELTSIGAEVAEVAAYESRCPQGIPLLAQAALLEKEVNIITFASSKTVRNFCQLIKDVLLLEGGGYQQDLATLLDGVYIASIGPQTSKDCLSLLGRVDIEAEEYTLDGLTQAIVKWATGL